MNTINIVVKTTNPAVIEIFCHNSKVYVVPYSFNEGASQITVMIAAKARTINEGATTLITFSPISFFTNKKMKNETKPNKA